MRFSLSLSLLFSRLLFRFFVFFVTFRFSIASGEKEGGKRSSLSLLSSFRRFRFRLLSRFFFFAHFLQKQINLKKHLPGGTVVILGRTGKNLGAGMSGGLAYVYDFDGRLPRACNEDVAGDLCPLDPARDEPALVSLLQRHVKYTGSTVARAILADWQAAKSRFVKVFPHEYRRALAEAEAAAAKEKAEKEAEAKALAALQPEVDAAKAREATDLALARALLLPGESAFDALKRIGMDVMARGEGLPPPPAPSGSPALDLARLNQDALDGRPVAGRAPTWEEARPVAVKAGTAVKRRGFIDYRRNPLPYRSVAERVHDWDEVQVRDFWRWRGKNRAKKTRASDDGDSRRKRNNSLPSFLSLSLSPPRRLLLHTQKNLRPASPAPRTRTSSPPSPPVA